MKQRKTILFLYSRLPDYFFRCIDLFCRLYGYKAIVIRYREDPDTRYILENTNDVDLLYRDSVDFETLVSDERPAAIILSSWKDKQYTRLCRKFVDKVPVVLALDNPCDGTLKQYLLSSVAAFTVRRFCNKVWAAGPSQFEYARRLGFAAADIFQDLYTADTERFSDSYEQVRDRKKDKYPRRIVYVGRLVDYKRPLLLAEVFNELVSEGLNSWTLELAGEGPLKANISNLKYKGVSLVDFIDPARLPEYYANAGIFCLPSIHEHWGVAVHEAAAAGLPLLLSDQVHARNSYLIHGYNGLQFASGNRADLKLKLRAMLTYDDEKLLNLADNSFQLGRQMDQSRWAAILNGIVTSR